MKGKVIWGFLFIILGVIVLLNTILGHEVISASDLWPFLVLALGISFEVSYFNGRKDAGLLVPGGILTTLGLLFIFQTFTNGLFSSYTYPIYTLSVAIGLFQLYLFGEKKAGLLRRSSLPDGPAL
jgi:thiol:disulfide interchange protein